MGSEMCIRDSALLGQHLELGDLGRATVSFEGGGAGGDGDVLRGCLLYTSDAADDLLCVDLGGRRIIKKKNL